MEKFSENEVRAALEPYHSKIRGAVVAGFAEWLSLGECRADKGFAPVLYSRTISNYVFDAIVRNAMDAFSTDPSVRVIDQVQTAKFCFGGTAVARFKKGDDDNLGQNIQTQAVLEFVNAQQSFPGMPPAAAKIEFIWTPDILGTSVESILVIARDGDHILWSYEIEEEVSASEVIAFPAPNGPDFDPPLVTPKAKPSEQDAKGN